MTPTPADEALARELLKQTRQAAILREGDPVQIAAQLIAAHVAAQAPSGLVEAGDVDKYFLKSSINNEWLEVSKEEWIRAERAAGFRPKMASDNPRYMQVCATGGFSSSYGISGKIEYAKIVEYPRPTYVKDALKAIGSHSQDFNLLKQTLANYIATFEEAAHKAQPVAAPLNKLYWARFRIAELVEMIEDDLATKHHGDIRLTVAKEWLATNLEGAQPGEVKA